MLFPGLKQLLCLVSPLLSFSLERASSTLVSAYSDTSRSSYSRAALMTVIQGCAVATIRRVTIM